MKGKKSIEQAFKEEIEKATNIGQVNGAVYITVNEFIPLEAQRKAFLDNFYSTTLVQNTGPIKEQYIRLFNHTCKLTWRKLERIEDDKAVNNFSNYMRTRLAESGDKGKGGWWKDATPIEVLYGGLLKAVNELRYVDIANYAMMLDHHKRVSGREVEKSLRLLDELDEAITQHTRVKFAVSNPPLSLGIQAAREKILREVEHEVYMTASNAINAIVQAGTKNLSDPATVGSVARARELLSKLLKE